MNGCCHTSEAPSDPGDLRFRKCVFLGYCEDTWGTDDGGRKHFDFIWGNLVLPLLEDVEVEYPQLPWAHGLRGLYDLCLARWDCHRLTTLRASDVDEVLVEQLARWEAEQAAAHLRIATEGDDPVALVGLVTAEELQRFAGSSPGPDGSVSEYVDEHSNGAALAKALHRFSSTVRSEGMMVVYDARVFLKLASWVLPDAPDAAEPLRHEIDRVSRFTRDVKVDFWFVPRTD
jgi:hypothetical protein